jgi:hypothetical protein
MVFGRKKFGRDNKFKEKSLLSDFVVVEIRFDSTASVLRPRRTLGGRSL